MTSSPATAAGSAAVLASGLDFFHQLGATNVTGGGTKSLLEVSLSSSVSRAVTSVHCGSHFSVALTSGGEVYQWGTDFEVIRELGGGEVGGVSGRGEEGEEEENDAAEGRRESCLLAFLGGGGLPPRGPGGGVRVTSLACGRRHCVALTGGREVFTWGCGFFGRLGHGSESGEAHPRLVETLEPSYLGAGHEIVSVACGGCHTAAVTASGCVYLWGWNRNYQCGHRGVQTCPHPALLDGSGMTDDVGALASVHAVVLGRQHSAVITTEGHLYTWGASTYGRLGHIAPLPPGSQRKGRLPPRSAVPRVVRYERRTLVVVQVASGDRHMLAQDPDGGVYSWGNGASGQCGHGDRFHHRTPKLVDAMGGTGGPGTRAAFVAAGGDCSFAVTRDGALYAWGDGETGALGLGEERLAAAAAGAPSGWAGSSSAEGRKVKDGGGGGGEKEEEEKATPRSFAPDLLDGGLDVLRPTRVPLPARVAHNAGCTAGTEGKEGGHEGGGALQNLAHQVVCGGGHSIVLCGPLAPPLPPALTGPRDWEAEGAVAARSDGSGEEREPTPSTPPPAANYESKVSAENRRQEPQPQQNPQQQDPQQDQRQDQQKPRPQQDSSLLEELGMTDFATWEATLRLEEVQDHGHVPAVPEPTGGGGAEGGGARSGALPQQQQHQSQYHRMYTDGTGGGRQPMQSRLQEVASSLAGSPPPPPSSSSVAMTMSRTALSSAEELKEQVFSFCRHGRAAEVETAVLGGFDVTQTDESGNTLLLLAAQQGLKKMAKKLLRMGADINAQNGRGQTALHYCRAYGHEELLAYLVGKGAIRTLLNAEGMTYEEGIRR